MKTTALSVLIATTCLAQEPPVVVPGGVNPSPPPLLSVQAATEDAFISGHYWKVETNWAPIGKLPAEPVKLRDISNWLTQGGLVSSNRYAVVEHGTNKVHVRIISLPLTNVSRTFQHLVVRRFSDGTMEVAE